MKEIVRLCKKHSLPILALLLVATSIFCFSTGVFSATATAQIFGDYNFIARKLAHVSEYAVLFLVSRYAMSKLLPQRSTLVHCVAALTLAALYAATDEWHQTFVPNRTGNVVDMYIDWCGALIGLTLFAGVKLLQRVR